MLLLRAITLIFAILLVRPETAHAQVTFQPSGCEFRVWFVTGPTITKASMPTADGTMHDTMIAELNLILNARFTFRLGSELRYGCYAFGNLGSRTRTHHPRTSPSRTLLGNEQTPGFLKQGVTDTLTVCNQVQLRVIVVES